MQIGPKLACFVTGVFRTPERYLKALKQGKPAVCSCRIKSGSRRRLFSFGWSSDADRAAFKEESCRLFQSLGWTVTLGHNGGCDTVTKDQQDLYLHPTSFSGVIDESNIQSLQKQILKAQTFHYEGVDRYEEYQDLSDEEYRATLEAQRDKITAYILERCRTKRRNLYIVAPVATDVAAKYEIRRLCDKDRRNRIGNRFKADLMDELLQIKCTPSQGQNESMP